MENSNWLLQEISSHAYDFLWSCINTSLFFGVIGLAAGIFLIVKGRRRNLFSRPNGFWTFIAKLNYVYTPVCLMLFLGFLGIIFGAQRQVNRWIDDTAEPIIAHATTMLPTIQEMGRHLDRSLTLEEMIHQEVSKEGASGGYQGRAYNELNTIYIKAFLAELGYPLEIDGFIRMLREQELSQLNASVLRRIPKAIKQYCGYYFWKGYKGVWLSFLPFLLAPIAELLIYKLVRRSRDDREEFYGYANSSVMESEFV